VNPIKALIRLLAFFAKEINEVRRQPRLVLSLLLGPALILALFGVGYRGSQPVLRTTIVMPSGSTSELDPEDLQRISGTNFVLTGIEQDQEVAMGQLRRGETDIVQVMPTDIESRALGGEQSTVTFTYDQVNPMNEQWIQYLGYAQVVEMNRAILREAATITQSEAQSARGDLATTSEQLAVAEQGIGSVDESTLRESLSRLRRASGLLAAGSVLAGEGVGAREEIDQLQGDIDALEDAIASGQLANERERIRTTRERVDRITELTNTLANIPPEVIVSPLRQEFANLNGRSLDLMTYYAPSVMALLIQHIAVTLGALSLVRERLLGATEFFRVAPVSASQILLGKYFGYTFFIAFIIAALLGLMLLLGVPFLGNPWLFAGLSLLLTLASLGVGLFISSISTSDSQAVQLSMLVLLLSIFFSGFFLPLENFWASVRAVGYALPITHGISGFHNLMLRGAPPSELAWVMLSCIAALTAAGALIMTIRAMRKVV
jgi:ABC-2 type transport system permease protein